MALTRVVTHDSTGATAGSAEAPFPLVGLTQTQLKVLRGVHGDLLHKQIAFDPGFAEATVKTHMAALMRKPNVRNRTQVAIAAQTLDRMRGTLAH